MTIAMSPIRTKMESAKMTRTCPSAAPRRRRARRSARVTGVSSAAGRIVASSAGCGVAESAACISITPYDALGLSTMTVRSFMVRVGEPPPKKPRTEASGVSNWYV